MKKLLKFRPKKNLKKNYTGILLTLFSKDFENPVRLNDFGTNKFSEDYEKAVIKSRGNVFYRAFFDFNIKDKNFVELMFYGCDKSIEDALCLVDEALVEVVDTRNPDFVIFSRKINRVPGQDPECIFSFDPPRYY